MPANMSEPSPHPRRISRLTTRRRAVVALGILVWVVVSLLLVWSLKRAAKGQDIVERLAEHLTTIQLPSVEVVFPADVSFARGDGVKMPTPDGLVAVGEVLDVYLSEEGSIATLGIYPEFVPRMTSGARFSAVAATGDVAWVVKTLFPPEKLSSIKAILWAAVQEQKDKLFTELRPGLDQLLAEAGWILKEDMAELLQTRRAEFEIIARVIREKAWEKHLRVAFNEDVWPLLESRARPLLAEIGNEMVAEAPVWALSWSYVVQNLPFTDDEALKRRVRKFIKEQAIPILERHKLEFRDLSLNVAREAFTNEHILSAVENGAYEVALDERFRLAVKSILNGWMTGNPRITALASEAWKRDEIQQPFRRLVDALEPELRTVGNLLLLDADQKGINPDLARILRRKLIGRDQSWIALEFSEAGTPGLGGRFKGTSGGSR